MYQFIAGERVTLQGVNEGAIIGGYHSQVDLYQIWYTGEDRTEMTAMVAGTTLTPIANEHAHINKWVRDCDGMHSSGYIARPSEKHRRSEFGDVEFREQVITQLIGVHSEGQLKLDDEGVTWDETTDEGYKTVTAVWCPLFGCEDIPPWSRDHEAEKAGY